jgi:phosphoglycolate phosphatase
LNQTEPRKEKSIFCRSVRAAATHTIIFDLDGTLIDSRPAILASLRHVQTQGGLQRSSDDELQWALGPPLRDIMCRLLKSNDPGLIEHAVATYREHHPSVCLTHARPYAGIARALARLHDAGCALYVCTSKLETISRRVLEHFNLITSFRAVHGSDPAGLVARKDALLRTLIDREHLDAARTVMVGDREQDISAARSVGMRTCAVTYGYASLGELEAAGPDLLCDSPAELPRVLLTWGSAPHPRLRAKRYGGPP